MLQVLTVGVKFRVFFIYIYVQVHDHDGLFDMIFKHLSENSDVSKSVYCAYNHIICVVWVIIQMY